MKFHRRVTSTGLKVFTKLVLSQVLCESANDKIIKYVGTENWETEAIRISTHYRNSVYNIAALSAADASEVYTV
jgi:hypothetical protein